MSVRRTICRGGSLQRVACDHMPGRCTLAACVTMLARTSQPGCMRVVSCLHGSLAAFGCISVSLMGRLYRPPQGSEMLICSRLHKCMHQHPPHASLLFLYIISSGCITCWYLGRFDWQPGDRGRRVEGGRCQRCMLLVQGSSKQLAISLAAFDVWLSDMHLLCC